jgi:hypothetical protein
MAANKTKSKKDKKPEVRKGAICTLDDLGWRPLIETYKLLTPRYLLSTDSELLAALRDGRLRYMRRPANSGPSQGKEGPRAFWLDRKFDATWIDSDELDICGPDAVPGPRRPWNPLTDFDGREFYVWRPEDVWPALQATAASKPEHKRAKGGGAKSMYTDEQIEFGKKIYRKMLRDDPSWRSASQDAVAKRVQEMAKNAGRELLGHLRTIYRNIVAPVNAETE